MNRVEIVELLSNLNGKSRQEKIIRERYPEVFNEVMNFTKNYDISFRERLYCFTNNTYPKTCKVCGKRTSFLGSKIGYGNYCCYKCCNSDPDKKEKTRQGLLEKYGVVSVSQTDEVKAKVKQTKLEKYGDEKYNNRDKCKQTCLERYGDENYRNINKSKQTKLERYGDEFFTNRDKCKQTCLERYGDEFFTNRDKCKQTKLERYGDEFYNNIELCKQTKLERYGNEGYNNRDKCKQTKLEHYNDEKYNNRVKYKQTKLERYGDEGYNNRDKSKQTCLEKYGVENPNQLPAILEKRLDTVIDIYLSKHSEILARSGNELICKCTNSECNKCIERIYKTRKSIYEDRRRLGIETCTTLLPECANLISGTSIELFVRQLLDKYNISYIANDRQVLEGRELDIYIPSYNLAVECNGVHFHSDRYRDSGYHTRKYQDCLKKDIQLISVWEDWIYKKPKIVSSIILSKLGIYQERIYARKCSIREISYKDSQKFLDDNHIQGSCKASIRLGLFYQEALVSVMVFSKSRGLMGQKGNYELSRFCSKLNTQIVGGAQKLFNYFLKNYPDIDNIISFSSHDISNGSIYEILGFERIRDNLSSWYIDKQLNRYHRTSFCKAAIVKRGWRDKIDDSWTEREVVYEHNIFKIYDSGQTKWEYKRR